MSEFKVTSPVGATPLDPDEIQGLIPNYITTQGELNELEQKNLQEAIVWVRNRRSKEILEIKFAYELHKQMFNQVWKWAGKTRTSEKNIGVDSSQIPPQLSNLLADTKYWVDHKSFSLDEIGVRFHHRLVQIHAFPNGNGRHARLMTNLLIESIGQPAFTWGMQSSKTPLEAEGVRRDEYIAALRAADKNDFQLLMKFVRT